MGTSASIDASCEPAVTSGELSVIISDDISEQMQDRILMANKGTLKKRTYAETLHQYINIVQVDAGKEPEAMQSLRSTPGVVSAEQTLTKCQTE